MRLHHPVSVAPYMTIKWRVRKRDWSHVRVNTGKMAECTTLSVVLTVHPRSTGVELRIGAARVDSEHFDVHAFQHGFVYNSQVHCGELGLGKNLDIRWRLYKEITYIRVLPK